MRTGIQALVVVTGTLMLTVGLAGCLGGTGTATVFVKDSHIDEFESINVTFTKVSIHRGEEGQMSGAQHGQQGGQDGRPDTDGAGWQTVFEGTKTIDLLDFNESDSRAFLGQANLSAGTYNQIVIDVQSVTGTKDDGSTVDFTVTTGWAKVAGAWQVESGQETRLILDINLENSVVKQGTDDWRFNPVIGRVIQEDGDGSTDSVRDRGTDGADGGDGGTGSQTTYVKDVPPGDHFAELWLDMSEVEVHAAANDSWVTVVDDNRSVDLLRFNETGSKAFLGDSNLSAGQYTHIRINVTEAWGIDHNGTRVNVTVPSGTARINRPFRIADNGTTAQVVIDLNLNRSLVRSGDGGQGGQGDQGNQSQAGSGWRLTPVIGKVIMNWVDDDPRADQADAEGNQTGGQPTTHRVNATGQNTFDPATVRIQPGDTVKWVNTGDDAHTVTSYDIPAAASSFDEVLDPGETFNVTLTEPGTYKYRCRFHSSSSGGGYGGGGGYSGMTGEIVVGS